MAGLALIFIGTMCADGNNLLIPLAFLLAGAWNLIGEVIGK